MTDCALCKAAKEDSYRIICKDEYSYAMIKRDLQVKYHILISPIRHVEDFKDLTAEESLSLHKMLSSVRKHIFDVTGLSAVALLNGFKHISQDHIHYQIAPGEFGVWNLLQAWLDADPKPEGESWEQYLDLSKEDKAKMAEELKFKCQ